MIPQRTHQWSFIVQPPKELPVAGAEINSPQADGVVSDRDTRRLDASGINPPAGSVS